MKRESFDPYNPPMPRGVYRPSANFRGTRRIEVVDSSGFLMVEVCGAEEVITEDFEKALRRILEEQDTGLRLRVVS
jgi:hypothetical protein